MEFLLKEDGDRLLKEDGGRFITHEATLAVTPSLVMRGFTYDLFVSSDEDIFTVASVVTLSGTGVMVNSTTLVSSSVVKANITVDELADLTARTITVTTGSSVDTLADAFTVASVGGSNTLRAGFQYTLLTRGQDIRRQPGITIRDVLNNQPNTCTFRVDGTSNTPLVGEKIEIVDEQDGDRLLFAGTVQSVDQIYEDKPDNIAWEVQAIDFTWLLNKYRPIGAYKNIRANLIVKDIIERFAPGFGDSFVQTDLSKVSISFDGSEDFSTCLNRLAEAIGGGHWYVDYDQVVHFFHLQPRGVDLAVPTNPQAPLSYRTGAPQTPLTATTGGEVTSWFTRRSITTFAMTFVYSNGVESAMSPWSDFIVFNGEAINFSALPTGAPRGSFSVVKRRIYEQSFTPSGFIKLRQVCEVQDNTTTSLTWYWGVLVPEPTVVRAIDSSVPLPKQLYVAPPTGPAETPYAIENSDLQKAPDPIFTGPSSTSSSTPGWMAYRTVNMYRDGTLSLPSPASAPIRVDGLHRVTISSIGIGQSIGDVDVVGRLIYGAFAWTSSGKALSQVVAELQASIDAGLLVQDYSSIIGEDNATALDDLGTVPNTYDALAGVIGYENLDSLMTGGIITPRWDLSFCMWVIRDNTSTTADVQPGAIQGPPLVGNANDPGEEVPLWPNPDGPNLEDTLEQPEDLTDDSVLLLKDPPFQKSVDLSQVRNRIFVRGAGSSLTAAAPIGSTTLSVTAVDAFDQRGGRVMLNNQQLDYIGVTVPSGAGDLVLASTLPIAASAGDVVSLFVQFEDIESQKALGAIELDKDGEKTDGVHEFTIVDTSLATPFQLMQRAQAELELFAQPIVTIRYATRDPKTHSGRKVNVNLTSPPCKGEFLIQDVTIDQIHDESDQLTPRYVVTASSVKFDLSDLLLQLLRAASDTSPSVTFAGISDPVVEDTSSTAPPSDSIYSRTVTLSLTVAEYLAIGTGGSVLVEGVPNYMIWPVQLIMEFNQVSSSTSLPTFTLYHDGGSDTLLTVGPSNVAGGRYQVLADSSGLTANTQSPTGFHPRGVDLRMKLNSAPGTGGSGTFNITVIYYLIPMLF